MAIGDKIRMLRRQRDWTQNELANKLGFHPQDLTRWERNKVKPRTSTLARLAELFEVCMDELSAQNGSQEPHLHLKTILQAMIAHHQVRNIVTC